jgi:NAD(P)-dependent dehydrogenase (short-subunit alcohol dehydrogenase family)
MLNDRICLVTGAGRGIGQGIALEMAKQGARAVVVLDVDDAGAETAEQVRAAGSESLFIQCDLRDRAQMAQAIDRVVAEYGGLDVLVNNAGVLERSFTHDVSFDTLPEDLWDLVMDVNLKAVWLLSRLAAPHLRRSTKSPAIVNAGSIAAKTAYSHAVYGVSKAAVLQLTRTMAVSLAPEVRVNAYCPGTIGTHMSTVTLDAGEADGHAAQVAAANLIPRVGRVEEVAKLVAFLASEDAAFITGANVDIDGGALAWRGLRDTAELAVGAK